MTVSHLLALRVDISDAVLALIDAGAGAGKLVFRTSGDVEVATLTFSNPAGTVAGGTGILTFSAITSDTNATGGTITKASIEDDAASKVLECAVATAASDINISSTTIGATDTVSCSALTYTPPT